jgi:hypothetical protein
MSKLHSAAVPTALWGTSALHAILCTGHGQTSQKTCCTNVFVASVHHACKCQSMEHECRAGCNFEPLHSSRSLASDDARIPIPIPTSLPEPSTTVVLQKHVPIVR